MGKIHYLCDSRDEFEFALGLHWFAVSLPGLVLRAGGIRVWDVPHVASWSGLGLQYGVAGFYGFPWLQGTACLLEAV